MKANKIFLAFILLLFLPCNAISQFTPVRDKVAVLITDWGMPAGYNLEYAWRSHDAARIGDFTQYPGQPCKIGHVGEFPYETHMGLIPWGLTVKWPSVEEFFDSAGYYELVNGVYVATHTDIPSITPDLVPESVPITPVSELVSAMTGELDYPPDPRTGENLLPNWYKIGSRDNPFPNGCGDLYEASPLRFMWYYSIMGGPTEPSDAYKLHPTALEIHSSTEKMLKKSFGDRIDVRLGMYNKVTGYSEHEWDVAEDFAKEGFRKMLLARETNDHNRYANEFFTANYVKERLCEIGLLDEMEIYQTRQVGRTPEINAMNVINLKPFIETHPEGSSIAIIYVTRGLPWGSSETPGPTGTVHPWSKEVYHENAFLNYLSWKKALQAAYGNRYKLVFTRDGAESDLLDNSLYTYGLYKGSKLGGHFHSIRDDIQYVKEAGIDKIIIAPCHWYFDNFDSILLMRTTNGIPVVAKEYLEAGQYDLTYCEDEEGVEVECDTEEAVAEITVAPSYSHLTQEFAISYYVVLRGTLERFNLYPYKMRLSVENSKLVTKLDGGTLEVVKSSSIIKGARIEIPADPYPDRPQGFTRETAIPINDPNDTNDCLWEDVTITIGYQLNPPALKTALSIGPAVHFGPYRTFFNRDVTITLPYFRMMGNKEDLKVYIYNHLTDDWDPIEPDSVDQSNRTVSFKTQVLGLFQIGVER